MLIKITKKCVIVTNCLIVLTILIILVKIKINVQKTRIFLSLPISFYSVASAETNDILI